MSASFSPSLYDKISSRKSRSLRETKAETEVA